MKKEKADRWDIGELSLSFAFHGIVTAIGAIILAVIIELILMLTLNLESEDNVRLNSIFAVLWTAFHLKYFLKIFSIRKSPFPITNEKDSIHKFETVSLLFLWSYKIVFPLISSPENATPRELNLFFSGWFSVLLAYHAIFAVIFWNYMKKKDFIMIAAMTGSLAYQIWTA